MRIQFFIYNHNIIWFRLLNYHDVTLGVGQVEPVLIYCFVENRSYLGQIVLSRVETHTLPLILLPVMFVFFFYSTEILRSILVGAKLPMFLLPFYL
jgi:hypothetical protein